LYFEPTINIKVLRKSVTFQNWTWNNQLVILYKRQWNFPWKRCVT